jgi:hypothetical protein
MTFLLPSLHNLNSSDSGIAVRFSNMASIILECQGSHPVVNTQAMAFFEVLSAHQLLLPPPSSHIHYAENPMLCCIPFIMENLRPDRPEIQPLGRWRGTQGCLSSIIGLRSTLRAMKMLSLSHILIAEWSDLKVVSLLYAALEATCGSRCFAGETFHRSLAAPREAEIVYSGGDATERELTDVLCLLVYLERRLSKRSSSTLLRWVLLSKTLIVGASDETDNDEEEENDSFTISNAIREASLQALSDSLPILQCASPVRWQVKSQAIKMARIALVELTESCHQNGVSLIESPEFNPTKARILCTQECRDTTAAGSSRMPQSRLVFHLSDVVTAACAASTATVDQAELQILQENAMQLLVELINSFGRIPDADQPDVGILSEFIPQLSSCIKSAIGACLQQEGEVSCRLFMVGCEALRAFMHTQVATDNNVLKRMARGALLSSAEIPFFTHQDGLPTDCNAKDEGKRHLNQRASLLVTIGKLWTVGSLPYSGTDLMSEVKAGIPELGVNSAALAIDGACLLLGSGLSLCGIALESTGKIERLPPVEFGFFYDNLLDIDDSVKASLAKTWAACGCSAVRFLSKSIKSEDTDRERREVCVLWLRKMVPLLFAGLHDSLSALSAPPSKTRTVEWAKEMDAEEIAVSCLRGITSLVAASGSMDFDDQWQEELERSVARISKCVLLPSLGQISDLDPAADVKIKQHYRQEELVATSCKLIEHLATTTAVSTSEGSTLLVTILKPLELVQAGSVDLEADHVGVILSTCLASVANLISQSKTPRTLVKAMVPLVRKILSQEKGVPETLKTSTRVLLKECLSHDAVSLPEHSRIACEMVNAGNWEAWTVVCMSNNGVAASKSLEIVQGCLLDSSKTDQQLGAVKAIRGLVQSLPTPSPLVGRIVFAVGSEVLVVFQAYAAQSKRTDACADCMKIILVALQQLSSDSPEEEILTAFLMVAFEAFIAVLRYNGLPNHPPPQSGSDPALGRMCAQAITHVARTTPAPFKTCMAAMSEHDRAVLEFAVRADMSGYAAPAAQAPEKKKLSLKGFKK